MDIFKKCYEYAAADELRAQDLFPYFRELQSRQDVEVVMEGKRRIMLGSNNYLGLTTKPEIIEAGLKAMETFGTGCSGSRLLNGTLILHQQFEKEMAAFLRKGDVATFPSGFQSNLGIISAIVGRTDYVICDKENHASIYDGCKLSWGKMLRYDHSDMEGLEKCLKKVPETAGALIGDALKHLFQLLHVAVLIAQHLAVGELAAVVNGGVILAVADNVIVSADDS